MRPLVNDAPLLIYPQLAMAIGLEEAVLLQQLHFRLHHQGVTRDGEIWYSQSYEHWQKQFPFWGIQKISIKNSLLSYKVNEISYQTSVWKCLI